MCNSGREVAVSGASPVQAARVDAPVCWPRTALRRSSFFVSFPAYCRGPASSPHACRVGTDGRSKIPDVGTFLKKSRRRQNLGSSPSPSLSTGGGLTHRLHDGTRCRSLARVRCRSLARVRKTSLRRTNKTTGTGNPLSAAELLRMLSDPVASLRRFTSTGTTCKKTRLLSSAFTDPGLHEALNCSQRVCRSRIFGSSLHTRVYTYSSSPPIEHGWGRGTAAVCCPVRAPL